MCPFASGHSDHGENRLLLGAWTASVPLDMKGMKWKEGRRKTLLITSDHKWSEVSSYLVGRPSYAAGVKEGGFTERFPRE